MTTVSGGTQDSQFWRRDQNGTFPHFPSDHTPLLVRPHAHGSRGHLYWPHNPLQVTQQALVQPHSEQSALPSPRAWSQSQKWRLRALVLNAGSRSESSVALHIPGFPGGTSGKEPACQCRRLKRRGFDPGSERSPGEGNGNPLQYSCLQNTMDRGVCGLHSMESQRVRHDWGDLACTHTNIPEARPHTTVWRESLMGKGAQNLSMQNASWT